MTANDARLAARVGGVLYLFIIIVGAMGEAVVRGRIVVPGDVTGTAANLRSMEWIWRLGVAGEVALLASATALALILYVLLRPVSRDLALLAVFFNLVSIAIEGVAAVSLATALAPLAGAAYLDAFSSEQLAAMAMLSVNSPHDWLQYRAHLLRRRVRGAWIPDLPFRVHAEVHWCSSADCRRLLCHQ